MDATGQPVDSSEQLSASLDELLNIAASCAKALEHGASLDDLRAARLHRARAAIEAVASCGDGAKQAAQPSSPPQNGSGSEADKATRAAIVIQSWCRRHLARKAYARRLYRKFARDEAERAARARRQAGEGELLLQNYALELELVEREATRRSEQRRLAYAAIVLQRAWRRRYRNQHCLSSRDGGRQRVSCAGNVARVASSPADSQRGEPTC